MGAGSGEQRVHVDAFDGHGGAQQGDRFAVQAPTVARGAHLERTVDVGGKILQRQGRHRTTVVQPRWLRNERPGDMTAIRRLCRVLHWPLPSPR
jgi:hypothetical protein